MWELLKKVQFTQAYRESTEPFWCSEYYDVIPSFDEHPMEYWTKEKILITALMTSQTDLFG